MILEKVGLWLGDLAEEYLSVVTKPPKTNHTEKHHILPASLFPEYEHHPDNIAILDILDHLKAHEILAKTGSKEMILAFWAMFMCSERRYSSLSEDERSNLLIKYEKARIKMAKVNSELGKKRIGELNPMFGKPQTKYAKTIVSLTHKNKKLSARHRRILSEVHKGIPKIKKECKHCHKMISVNLLNRWHNDNCKFKED